MKRLLIILLIIPFYLAAESQESSLITLSDCYRDAEAESRLSAQKNSIEQVYSLKDKNITSGWLPSLEAGATALYNTSVVDLSGLAAALPAPGLSGIGGMPNDQYKLTLDINQLIYDGGAIKGSREIEAASREYELKGLDAEIYKIKEQVNSAFFGIIILRKQVKLLKTYSELIDEKMKAVKTAVDNGVLLPTDYETLRSEKVKIKQQLTEASLRIDGLLSVLSSLTGKDFTAESEFVLPENRATGSDKINRPELQLFDLKSKQVETTRLLINSTRLPKAFGFATLGYGSPPGNNFFTDSFGTYAIFGAGIKWTITDWKKSKRNKQMIDLNKAILDARKGELSSNLERAIDIKRSEIMGLESMLESDKELIDIRRSITAATELKLQNGVITATDYLAELNAEKQAMLNREMHLVNLSRAYAEYCFISGKEIN